MALNNPIAPNAFNRSEETKYSLVKNWNFCDMTLFDLMSDTLRKTNLHDIATTAHVLKLLISQMIKGCKEEFFINQFFFNQTFLSFFYTFFINQTFFPDEDV